MSDNAKYYPSTVTNGRIKIHKITPFEKEGQDTIYFAGCSLLTGKDRWLSISLKVSRQLTNLAKGFAEDPSTIPEGRLFEAEILDLHFTSAPNPDNADKPYLDNEGLLTKLSMPWF